MKSDPYDEKEPAEVGSYRIATCARQDMRTGASLSFVLGDHLGSTSSIINASGQEVAKSLYKAWGETRFTSGASPTRYTYTGQYSNVADFGLMYFGARWMDPGLGRFTSPDTIIPDQNNVQSWDRFAYVGNNPVNYTDPTGHMRIQEGDQRDRYSPSVAGKYVPKPKPPKDNDGGNNAPKERIIRVGEFQMLPNFSIPFESYSEAAEQGYDGHSWGGSLDGPLNPPVGGINVQYVSVQTASGVSIFNDFAIGHRPAILKAVTPNTQSVYIGYTTEYKNVPRVDGTANLTLTRIMIRNEEKFTSISYNVYINNNRAGISLPPKSAAPGTWANIAAPNNFSINNGMQMVIAADNACYGACYTTVNPVLLLGRSEIYVSP